MTALLAGQVQQNDEFFTTSFYLLLFFFLLCDQWTTFEANLSLQKESQLVDNLISTLIDPVKSRDSSNICSDLIPIIFAYL